MLGITELTPYPLRESSANMLKMEGFSLDGTQKMLGYSSITTTILYLE